MDDDFHKSSQNEISNNNNIIIQNDENIKNNISSKISKHNKDILITKKHKSNFYNHHRKYLNSLIPSNNKPKYKSQRFKISLKYMKDKIIISNLSNSQKHMKQRIIKMKKSSKKINDDDNKNNEIPLNANNFDNLPSFTKELRKALYSKSDIDSKCNSKSINKLGKSNLNKDSFNEKKENENDSEQNSESDENSDGHMHEDNQTLMDAIRHNSITENNNIKDEKDNLTNNEINNNQNKNNNEKNNYKYNDLLLTISTTMTEVEKIQSNIENANNNISLQQNKNNSLDQTSPKNNLIQTDDKKSEENNSNNQINTTEKNNTNINSISPVEKKNSINILNVSIIMIASSLEKDIRSIYKFKSEPLGGGNFGTVRKAFRKADKENKKYFAIKSIPKKNLTEKDFTNLIKEVNIISGLSHPNIINFYETYHDNHFFHLVMELCEGRDSYRQIVKKEKSDEKKSSKFNSKSFISYCTLS